MRYPQVSQRRFTRLHRFARKFNHKLVVRRVSRESRYFEFYRLGTPNPKRVFVTDDFREAELWFGRHDYVVKRKRHYNLNCAAHHRRILRSKQASRAATFDDRRKFWNVKYYLRKRGLDARKVPGLDRYKVWDRLGNSRMFVPSFQRCGLASLEAYVQELKTNAKASSMAG
jgi:hypothetical protein